MTERYAHLMTYVDCGGELQSVAGAGCVQLPSSMESAVPVLERDLGLAIDCLKVFGGIPIPVARQILASMGSARSALELALRNASPTVEPAIAEAN